MNRDELVAWALGHAEELETEMEWHRNEFGGYWTAVPPEAKARIRARATSALEFLRRYAGSDSEWFLRAARTVETDGDRQSMESGARALGELLRGWAEQVRVGVVDVHGVDVWSGRGALSTDLMEQTRRLLEDRSVHPAAPIMLSGAALEVALRGVAESLEIEVNRRPTIQAIADSLRREGLLSQQDVKDVQQMAGVRNEAAHGHFDELSRERAGLMEQQVNMFLSRLRAVTDNRASDGRDISRARHDEPA